MEKPSQNNRCIWAAALLAVGLCIAAFLQGGVYQSHIDDVGTSADKEVVVVRVNRFTGNMRLTTAKKLGAGSALPGATDQRL